jgi:uncharacterized lipoprotein YajG
MRDVTARATRALSVVLLAMLVSACAFTDHDTVPRSTAVAGNSDIGAGTKLYFRFVDDRDDVVVGHRGPGGNGAKITASTLPGQVESDLRDALVKKHFSIVPVEQGADASVVYHLRSFKFDLSRGFFTGGENAAAALAVDARRKDRSYDKVYRYSNEERVVVVPTGDQIDDRMNTGLTSILQQAYGDSALDAFLAGR